MATETVLATLAAGGERALRLANVIQSLVIEAGKLGELEIAIRVVSTGQVMTEDEADALPPEQLDAIRDHLVRVKRFPSRWLDRLADAINRDLLWVHADEEIVRIMLMGPR